MSPNPPSLNWLPLIVPLLVAKSPDSPPDDDSLLGFVSVSTAASSTQSSAGPSASATGSARGA